MITSEEINSPYYNLKSLIHKKGYTQKEIAEKIEMDRGTFSVKINRYKGRDFDLSEAVEIAAILGVTIDDFF